MALNKAGETTWKARYEAFGKARIDHASTAQINLRLPGQYFDAETGLHQNWNRDYAPGIGRYVQADPLGIFGGMNVYEYAYGNPMLYIDEKGEFANLIIGGAIGFGFDLMAQLMQNGGNWKCVNVKQLAISTAFGMIGGFAGGKGLSSGLSKLSIKTKGKIGESLSLINNRLKLSKLVARNEKTILGHRTIVDSTWRSLDGSSYYVESKFGKSQLSRLQKKHMPHWVPSNIALKDGIMRSLAGLAHIQVDLGQLASIDSLQPTIVIATNRHEKIQNIP